LVEDRVAAGAGFLIPAKTPLTLPGTFGWLLIARMFVPHLHLGFEEPHARVLDTLSNQAKK
jgi:hypothetical protein